MAMGITFTVYTSRSATSTGPGRSTSSRARSRGANGRRIEPGLMQRLAALNHLHRRPLPRPADHARRRVPGGDHRRLGELPPDVRRRRSAAAASGPTSAAPTSCATATARSTCSRTTCACRRACRTCSRTARSSKRVFPELFEHARSCRSTTTSQLLDMLAALAPAQGDDPEVVVLTPGIYNSAYFEHSFLAQQMGCELVEGRDLVVGDDDCVYMRRSRGSSASTSSTGASTTTSSIPRFFDQDSMLGVPGLMRAWRARATSRSPTRPGAGVADDKVVYAYVPEIIHYYLGEEAILPNVPTYRCADDERARPRARPSRRAGRQAGQRVGRLRHADRADARRSANAQQFARASRRTRATTSRSRSSRCRPCRRSSATHRAAPRRPAAVHPAAARETYVTPGGLTRVALRQGSLVVNSSQGGGSKDTWIVDTEV